VDVLRILNISMQRACYLAGITIRGYRYAPKRELGNMKLTERIRTIAKRFPRWGMPRIYTMLRSNGVHVNHKRVSRLYSLNKLQLAYRRKTKRHTENKKPIPVPERPNRVWALDFVHDALFNRRSIRFLNVIDGNALK